MTQPESGNQISKPPEIFMDPYLDQDRMNALADKIKAQSASDTVFLLPGIKEPLAEPAQAAGRVIELPRHDPHQDQAA